MIEPSRGLGVLEDARFVAERARHVHLDAAAVEAVAADLIRREVPVPTWNSDLHFTDGTARTANYLLLLDALNFSFWGEPRWYIEYRGQSLRGYWALAASLKRAIEEGLPVDDARFMAAVTPDQLRHILRGTGDIPLFDYRVAHMREVGHQLLALYDGQFTHAIESCQKSAVALTRLLARDFPNFEDVSPYEGRVIRIYKRAQILPADLFGAFGGKTWGEFHDIGELTAFADYKVPQVLEKLGILRYSPELEAKLRSGTVLPHHSTEEVELRALTIWGTEALRVAMARQGREVKAIEVDWLLWDMGLTIQPPKDKPYHLTRTTAY
ncbi:MAG: queuosine 5'-phosphate N-glycosylase/hydrolase [Candidatus Sericytochromatia bacterium]